MQLQHKVMNSIQCKDLTSFGTGNHQREKNNDPERITLQKNIGLADNHLCCSAGSSVGMVLFSIPHHRHSSSQS